LFVPSHSAYDRRLYLIWFVMVKSAIFLCGFDRSLKIGIFTDAGAYPPKPPPLVDLQRNPSGLRFFCKNGHRVPK